MKRFLLAALLLIAQSSWAAITYDTAASQSGNAVGSLTTASFTVAGDFGVCIAGSTQTGIAVSSVTIAGQTATSAGTRAVNGDSWTHMYYAVGLSTGTQTASVTYDDTWGTDLTLSCVILDGVNQSTPVANYTSANGSSTAVSLTVPSLSSGSWVVDGVTTEGSGSVTAGANQTERATVFQGNTWSKTSTQAASDGGAMTWTLEFTANWAQVAIEVLEAGGGGGGAVIPVMHYQLRNQ